MGHGQGSSVYWGLELNGVGRGDSTVFYGVKSLRSCSMRRDRAKGFSK